MVFQIISAKKTILAKLLHLLTGFIGEIRDQISIYICIRYNSGHSQSASLLAHERSRFAICQWELSTPTDISIPLTHRLVLRALEAGGVRGMLICVQIPVIFPLLSPFQQKNHHQQHHWENQILRPYPRGCYLLHSV